MKNLFDEALTVGEEGMDFFDVLTQKRIEILRTIRDYEPCSIRNLAKIVDRNISNVFEDLQLLNNLDLVDFIKQGRKKKPVVKHETIIIKFTRVKK